MRATTFLLLLLAAFLSVAGCGDDKKSPAKDEDAATNNDGGNTDDGGDVPVGDGGILMGCAAGEVPTGTFPVSGGRPIWGGWKYVGATSGSGGFTAEEDICARTIGFYINPIVGFPATDLTDDQKKDALCALNHGAELTIDHGGVIPNAPESCAQSIPCSPETKLQWDSETDRGFVYQDLDNGMRQMVGYARFDEAGRLLLGPGPGFSAYEAGPPSYSCF